MNTAKIEKRGDSIFIFDNQKWNVGAAGKGLKDGQYTIGIRPHNIAPFQHGATVGNFNAKVIVTEISGSESVIHARVNDQTWISQSHGIHTIPVGSTTELFVDLDQSMFFDEQGRLVS
jgi:glycerol transport system ATP-binding protein